MSASYAALMNLSAQYTATQENAVQVALVERQRKEEARKKAQAEKERQEREREAQLRKKRLEEQQRAEERKAKQEEEARAREREAARREKAELDKLLGNSKKPRPTGSQGLDYPASGVARRKAHDDDAGPVALTREELRQRKLEASMRRQFTGSARKPGGAGAYSKAGRRLAGGALDVVTDGASASSSAGKTVRERLAGAPVTLTKLNTVKRDTRTIDEILRDNERARRGEVVQGDSAKEFSGWFTDTKKKEPAKKPQPASGRSTQSPMSGSASPMHASSSKSTPGPVSSSSQKTRPSAMSATKATSSLRHTTSTSSFKAGASRPSASSKGPARNPVSISALGTRPAPKAAQRPAAPLPKKRARSGSYSDDEYMSPSPPPMSKKRRNIEDEEVPEDMRSMIWKLMGKDRNTYVSRDVYSDDEDMEVDTRTLEREEKASMRAAKRDDEEELRREMLLKAEKARRKQKD